MEIYLPTAVETEKLGNLLGKLAQSGDVFCFTGDLGAGKTCFTNGLLYGLGFFEGGSSPTFTIVNEYPTNPKINHFDLYRIKSEDELFDMGFADYFDKGGICIIEWPQIASDFEINVSDVKLNAGAGFIVILTGKIMTMPGLPKKPAYENIDVDENGNITGLF